MFCAGAVAAVLAFLLIEDHNRRPGKRGPIRLVASCSAFALAYVLAALVPGASAGPLPTQIAFSVCPNVTQTIQPGTPPGPDDLGAWTKRLSCGQPITSAGYTCGFATHPNSDLGTFSTSQNPLGVAVHMSAPNDCSTNPPTFGPGVDAGKFAVSVAQQGYCPTTTRTIPAQTDRYGAIIVPIGTVPLGSYSVTLTFPDQSDRLGNRATGTLHVGGQTFTETGTEALARPGRFAVLLDNSIAGKGAGELVSAKNRLTGTDYYACGAIKIEATVRYGKRSRNGVARMTGDGLITGGTGNYADLKGSFAVRGSYNARTNRGTFVLKGIATY